MEVLDVPFEPGELELLSPTAHQLLPSSQLPRFQAMTSFHSFGCSAPELPSSPHSHLPSPPAPQLTGFPNSELPSSSAPQLPSSSTPWTLHSVNEVTLLHTGTDPSSSSAPQLLDSSALQSLGSPNSETLSPPDNEAFSPSDSQPPSSPDPQSLAVPARQRSSSQAPKPTKKRSAFDSFIMSSPWTAAPTTDPRRKACWRCRLQKLKCDGQRPCARCVRVGVSGACQQEPSAPPSQEPERPVKFKVRSISLLGTNVEDWECLRPSHGPLSPLDRLKEMFNCEMAMNRKQHDAIASLVPSNVREALETLRSKGSAGMELSRKLIRNPDGNSTAGDLRDALSVLKDNLASTPPETTAGAGWLSQIADHSVSWYPQAFMFNTKFSEMCGLHCEELAARLANGEATMPSTELDLFCRTIDRILISFKKVNRVLSMRLAGKYEGFEVSRKTYDVFITHQRPARGGKKPQKQATLVRHCFQSTMFGGRFIRTDFWLEPVTPEEFDRAVVEHPDQCRPLLRSAGDLRSGREILESATKESEVTLSELSRTSYGNILLKNLESKIVEETEGLIDETSHLLDKLQLSFSESSSDSQHAQPGPVDVQSGPHPGHEQSAALRPEDLVGGLDEAWNPDFLEQERD